MANLFTKDVTVGVAYARLAAGHQSGVYAILCKPANVGAVTIKDPLGNESVLVQGQYLIFRDCDLYDLQIKGTLNDVVQVYSADAAGYGDTDSALGAILTAIKTAVEIMDDWDETNRAAVNVIAGQAGITAGDGAVAANTPRMTLASDDPAVAKLTTIDVDTGVVAATVDQVNNVINNAELSHVPDNLTVTAAIDGTIDDNPTSITSSAVDISGARKVCLLIKSVMTLAPTNVTYTVTLAAAAGGTHVACDTLMTKDGTDAPVASIVHTATTDAVVWLPDGVCAAELIVIATGTGTDATNYFAVDVWVLVQA